MQKEQIFLIAQEATVSHRVHRPRMQPEGAALWCGTRATPASQASLSFQRETSSHSLGSDWDSGSTCSCAVWGDCCQNCKWMSSVKPSYFLYGIHSRLGSAKQEEIICESRNGSATIKMSADVAVPLPLKFLHIDRKLAGSKKTQDCKCDCTCTLLHVRKSACMSSRTS